MTQTETPQKPSFCGFLNVLKPPGISSAQVVGRVRRMLGGEKVGHAGTLDPEAAGVLPLMVGKAARLFDYMQDKEKAYIAEVCFGSATDTQDAQGHVTAIGDHYPDEAALLSALPKFTGNVLQTPPMFSALKRDGQRLYDLARRGESVALEARPVTVHQLSLLNCTKRHGALLSIHCSKGFYVRTLCYNLGQELGCPAHMRFLLRTQSGVFTLETAQTLENLQTMADQGVLMKALLPMDLAVQHLPRIDVAHAQEKALRNGIPLRRSAYAVAEALAEGQPVCLRLEGMLVAIGECREGEIRQRTWLAES